MAWERDMVCLEEGLSVSALPGLPLFEGAGPE